MRKIVFIIFIGLLSINIFASTQQHQTHTTNTTKELIKEIDQLLILSDVKNGLVKSGCYNDFIKQIKTIKILIKNSNYKSVFLTESFLEDANKLNNAFFNISNCTYDLVNQNTINETTRNKLKKINKEMLDLGIGLRNSDGDDL